MIEVEHLTKRYADHAAVSDLGFRIEPGEVVGFLGPNGAGKSTTLRMLTGYVAPTSGRIRVAGVDAIARPVQARRHLGYLPESVPLYGEMRVYEYLLYRARLKGVKRGGAARRVEAALEMANVEDARTRIVSQLSKGYRSRVGLADALVADPPLLILDEPTAGLDPNQIRQMRELIRGLGGSKTVLLSTHILPEVESTCERVLIIHRGRLVGSGAPATLRTSGSDSQLLVVVTRGDPARMREVLERIPGVRRVSAPGLEEQTGEGPSHCFELDADAGPAVSEGVFREVAAAGLTLSELRRARGSLEDVFARLTTQEQAPPDAAPHGPTTSEAVP
ncbi:MAG: ABC transporter ATP-binding protein [Proteobacteria bacterium]|nr:ABC transporter ATP-binding protein [Pseudomonadota bacterium]